MTQDDEANEPGTRLDTLFHGAETALYGALGLLLVLVAAVALLEAGLGLVRGLSTADGPSTFASLDGLLFVLMLVEILHTVRVSLRSGELTAEPFLVVALIATIRRVLVITLQTSSAAQGEGAAAPTAATFSHSMIELGVLGGLILVMVISIWLLRRRPAA